MLFLDFKVEVVCLTKFSQEVEGFSGLAGSARLIPIPEYWVLVLLREVVWAAISRCA